MPYFLNKYYSPRKIFFFLGEGILIFSSLILIYLVFRGSYIFIDNLLLYSIRATLVTAIFQISLYFFDLYDQGELLSTPDIAVEVLQAFGVGCVLLAIMYYIFPISMIPTRIFIPAFIAVCVSVFSWRFLYNQIISKKMFAKTVIIIGTGKIASDIAHEIQKQRDTGFEIVMFIGEKNPKYVLPSSIPIHPDVKQLTSLCLQNNIEQVVVAIDDRRGKTPIRQLMDCKFMGFPVENSINFYEKLTGKILVENVNPGWIIFSSGFSIGRLQKFGKQVVDLLLALIGLVVTLPITLITGLIVKLESPGPIFYSQERVGLYGKPFKVIKFRSMREDAEKDGPVWATRNDTRVTRYGQFIRKTRIDELPQLINVIKGEMSFVGPRPERPIFVDQLARKIPYYNIRHNVMPGITGWAQICYPYGDSEEDALRKLEYDLYYLKYMSIAMDISIIFQTVKTVLFRKGSR